MATIATPSGNSTLPAAGADMVAEPIAGWINAIKSFLNEAGNIDEANADLSGSDGLVGKSTAQTITGTKTIDAALILTGTYAKPLRVATLRLWYDTTNTCLRVKHGSDPSSATDGNPIVEG